MGRPVDRSRARVLGAALLALVLGAGCGTKEPTAEELLARDAPKIEPKLVALEKIAQNLPAATGTIKLAGPPLDLIGTSTTEKTGNATFAYEADLADLTTYARIDLRTSDTMELVNDCFMLVRKHSLAGIKKDGRQPMWDDYLAKDRLPACVLLRYLLVIKLKGYSATQYIDKETFGAGDAAGEVLVFDLETGTYAGGVEFSAESSQFAHDASSDLRDNVYRAMTKAVQAALPDAKLM